MRILFDALRKCWFMLQNRRELPDPDSDDEEPLSKHRRLSLDRRCAPAMKRAAPLLLTRDVGVLCGGDRVSVNDKGVMVGTTGIAALKAEYGDDFRNFEIIQDVGYSSESSTHLSSDDGLGPGRPFDIRVYHYADMKPVWKGPRSPSSLDDSGLGGTEISVQSEPREPEATDESDVVQAGKGERADPASDASIPIQNRSCSVSSSQRYYTIIPLESGNEEEADAAPRRDPVPSDPSGAFLSWHRRDLPQTKRDASIKEDSEELSPYNTFRKGTPLHSTPIEANDFVSANLKRKRESDVRTPHRLWLRELDGISPEPRGARRSLFVADSSEEEEEVRRGASSCDASGESSSSDEGHPLLSSASSSVSSCCPPGEKRRPEDSFSREGSAETVVRLPPPPAQPKTHPLSCKDPRWMVPRASSEGDVLLQASLRSSPGCPPDWARLHSHSLPSVIACKSSTEGRSDDPTCARTSASFSSDPCAKKKSRSKRRSSGSNRTSRSTAASGSRHRACLRKRSGGSSEGSLAEVIGGVHNNLKEELELALSVRRTAESPSESDAQFARLEEQSTVSDQVWDGYQDMPYLSEAYSEATADEDAIRKLTEFGDDYISAIGQFPRFSDACGVTEKATPKSPTSRLAKLLPTASVPYSDTDSDLEDLYHVIEEADRALLFARATLQRRQDGDFFSSAQNAELLATCSTYLHWLNEICDHLDTEKKQSCLVSDDVKELYSLAEEWRLLKQSVEMFEVSADGQFENAQKAIDAIFRKLAETTSEAEDMVFTSWEDLQLRLAKLQSVSCALSELREELLAANLRVHRLGSTPLKEDVVELYRRWEDARDSNSTCLTNLDNLSSVWAHYRLRFQSLHSRFAAATNSLDSANCDKYCLFEEGVRAELDALKEDAHRLSDRLRGSEDVRRTLQFELRDLELRIDAHFSLRRSASPRGGSPEKGKEPQPRRKGFWRVLRAAVPVQLTLLLLLCFACYLEPRCCDRLNTFRFSLSPQLRFPGGPPPV